MVSFASHVARESSNPINDCLEKAFEIYNELGIIYKEKLEERECLAKTSEKKYLIRKKCKRYTRLYRTWRKQGNDRKYYSYGRC